MNRSTLFRDIQFVIRHSSLPKPSSLSSVFPSEINCELCTVAETKEIVNKVAQSGILTLDLEQLIPDKEHVELDIKDQLFQGLILKEKDFRTWVKENDWSIYQNKRVAVFCSTDAIIPTWAYMLVTKALVEADAEAYYCMPSHLNALVAERILNPIKAEDYVDKRVVIKGCGDREISENAFVSLSAKLLPVVKTLMYGEPCSTVPIYKKK
ncbi:DUF2480 family protein [bacterium]|nr:DUF2480 family protein [bacterium]